MQSIYHLPSPLLTQINGCLSRLVSYRINDEDGLSPALSRANVCPGLYPLLNEHPRTRQSPEQLLHDGWCGGGGELQCGGRSPWHWKGGHGGLAGITGALRWWWEGSQAGQPCCRVPTNFRSVRGLNESLQHGAKWPSVHTGTCCLQPQLPPPQVHSRGDEEDACSVNDTSSPIQLIVLVCFGLYITDTQSWIIVLVKVWKRPKCFSINQLYDPRRDLRDTIESPSIFYLFTSILSPHRTSHECGDV